jgi:hypothetical protein
MHKILSLIFVGALMTSLGAHAEQTSQYVVWYSQGVGNTLNVSKPFDVPSDISQPILKQMHHNYLVLKTDSENKFTIKKKNVDDYKNQQSLSFTSLKEAQKFEGKLISDYRKQHFAINEFQAYHNSKSELMDYVFDPKDVEAYNQKEDQALRERVRLASQHK